MGLKKYYQIILCFMIALGLIGCGEKQTSSDRVENQSQGVNEVLEEGMAAAEKEKEEPVKTPETTNLLEEKVEETIAPTEEPEATPESDAQASAEGIDVDLTTLSSTLVFSEVSNMMNAPQEYIGKTVKMKGKFTQFHDKNTGKYYFACLIQDALACCAQGIEFELTDEYVFPDDYPVEADEICVVGVFDTYQEGTLVYCTLRNAKLV